MSNHKEVVKMLREELRANQAMLAMLEATVQVVDDIHGDDAEYMMERAEQARGMIDLAVMFLKGRDEKMIPTNALV